MSLEQLEMLITSARKALARPPERSVFTSARYRCELRGESLIGTGDWSIQNLTSTVTLVPLDELHLALSNARIDSKPAVLGVVDTPTLRLEKPGANRVYFDWSLRGKVTKSAYYFDFRVPTCALNEVEVKLPLGHLLTASTSGVLITGPHEFGDSKRRLWRVRFGGRSRVMLVVHSAGESQTARPLIITRVKTDTVLSHNELTEERTFFIELYHRTLKQLAFTCPSSMEPFEVTSPAGFVQEWDLSRSGQRSTLRVVLRKPVGDVELPPITIRSRVPLKGAGQWQSPPLKLIDSLVLDETLTFRIASSIDLGQWSPGGFLIERMTRDTNGQRQYILRANGNRSLNRPQGRIVSREGSLAVNQADVWHIGKEAEELHSTYTVRQLHGQRRELVIVQPKTGNGEGSWEIVSVNAAPIPVHRWSHLQGLGQLVLEFSSALPRNVPIKVDVVWKRRSILSLRQPTRRVVIPHARPLTPGPYKGETRITTEPDLAVDVRAGSDGMSVTHDTNSLALSYRSQGPRGFVEIHRKPAVLQALWNASAIRRGDWAEVSISLDVKSITYEAPYLDLAFAEPLSVPLVVKTAGEKRSRRIPALLDRLHIGDCAVGVVGQLSPLTCASVLPRCNMVVWRIPLGKNAGRRTRVLLTTAVRNASGAEGSNQCIWRLPVPRIIPQNGMALSRGTYRLYGWTKTTLRSASSGSMPITVDDRNGSIVFSCSAESPALVLREQLDSSDQEKSSATCDRADWVTVIRRGLDWLHYGRFRIRNWQTASLRVELPAGSAFLSVRVDGRRIDAVSIEASSAATVVAIPIDRTAVEQSVEIVWTLPAEKSFFGWRERLQPPRIAVPPSRFRHRLRVEDGLSVVGRPGLLSNSEKLLDVFQWVHSSWRIVDRQLLSVSDRTGPQLNGPDLERWNRAVTAFVKKNEGRQIPLAEAIAEIVLFYAPEPIAVYVDRAALSRQNITPTHPISISRDNQRETVSLWERNGLTIVTDGGKVILTTTAGRDRALEGKLLAFADWIAAVDRDSDALSFLQPLLDGQARWTEWDIVPPTEAADIVVVDETLVRAIAWSLAGLAFLATWLLASWLGRVVVGRCALIAVAGLVIAPLWVPTSMRSSVVLPCAAVVVSALLWSAGRRITGVLGGLGLNAAVAVVACGLLLSLVAFAGMDSRPYPIYVLSDQPGKALVPIQLLQELRELSEPEKAPWPDAVVVNAYYKARVAKDTLHLNAQFDVYCSSEDATVVLPVTSGQLKDGTLVDGAPAYPLPLDDSRDGYRLAIKGKKERIVQVSMPFQIAVESDGPERYADLRIAPALQNRLELAFSEKVEQPFVLGATGMQEMTSKNGEPLNIICDIGRFEAKDKDEVIRVQWRTAEGANIRPRIEAKEYHDCRLQEGHIEWASVVDFHVLQGRTRRLELVLPNNAHVRAVEMVRPTGSVLGGSIPVRDWIVTKVKSGKKVTVVTESPLGGKALLIVRWVALRNDLEDTWQLEVPVVLNVGFLDGAIQIGCDSDFEIRQISQMTLTPRPLGKIQETWSQFLRPQSSAKQKVFAFRRQGSRGRIIVARVRPKTSFEQQVRWNVRHNGLEMVAHLRVAAPDRKATVVKWEVPDTLEIERVESDSVVDWDEVSHGKGKRTLRIWLHNPADSIQIEIRGWLEKPRAELPGSTKARRPVILSIPAVRFVDADQPKSRIEITSDDEWKIVPNRYGSLRLVSTGKGVAFEGEHRSYFISVRAVPVQERPVGEALVLYELDQDYIFVTGWLEAGVHGRTSRDILVRVGSWHNARLPGLIATNSQGKPLRVTDNRNGGWLIKSAAASDSRIRIQFSTVFAIPRTTPFTLPMIRFAGVKMRSEALVLQGSRFDLASVSGCSLLPSLPQGWWTSDVAALLARKYKAWSIDNADAVVQVTKRAEKPARFAASILFGKEAITWDGRTGWDHCTYYYVLANDTADLRVELPQGSKLITVDADMPARWLVEKADRTVTITLPKRPRVYRVQLVWHEPGGVTTDLLNLSAVRIHSVDAFPFRRDFLVPKGFFVAKPPVPQPSSPILSDRKEARTLLRALERIPIAAATSSRKRISAFEQACLWAALRYRTSTPVDSEPDREDEDLHAGLGSLRRRFGGSINEALHSPAPWPVDRGGRHLSWWDVQLPARTLTVSLGSERQAFETARFWQTQAVLLFLGLALALSFVSMVRRVASLLWPEAVLLGGIIGTLVFGLSIIGVGMFVFAIGARLVLTGLSLRSWWRSRLAAASGDSLAASS